MAQSAEERAELRKIREGKKVGPMFQILNIPIIAHHYGKEVTIGTADVGNEGAVLRLQGETLNEVGKLVEMGAEMKAFHVSIEMVAAKRKED